MRRWYCNAMRESRSPPPFNEEPQISKDFWGFFIFLSSDFTDESEGNLAYRITHGFSRNLAVGQWLAPEMSSYCFLSRRFRRWRRFFLIDYFSPTDFTDLHRFFLIDYFSPTDIMDSHRFFSLIIFLMGIYTDFLWFSSFSCHFFFFSVISLFRRF